MVIFRIIYKLVARLWLILYFPLSIARKYIFSLALAVMIAYVFVKLFSGDPQNTYRNPVEIAHGGGTAGGLPNSSGSTLQTVELIEDGNSVFASDLLNMMQPNELLYYSQLFYWVMANQADNTAHAWSNLNTGGSLTAHARFKNKLGATCRRFTETLRVQTTQQEITGISCQKLAGSWCKLRNNSTPACNLGRKPGFASWWGDMKRKIGRIF